MARFVNDMGFQASLMVVNITWGVPRLIREVTPLLNGDGVVTERGWHQTVEINYLWASPYERENLQYLPQYGIDAIIPPEKGWAYDSPSVTEISPTIHLYNITVSAQRYTATRPNDTLVSI